MEKKQVQNWTWNPLKWKEYFSTGAQHRSWLGHGVGTAVVGLVGALVGWYWIAPLVGFTLAASLMAIYYILIREPADVIDHIEQGHDDVSYAHDHGPIHFKTDRWGDSVGPACVAGTAWLCLLLSLL